MRTVVILVFNEFQMLDVIGPSDVFSAVNRIHPASYRMRVASLNGGPVPSNSALLLQSVPLAQVAASTVHTLLVAGAESAGLNAGLADAATARWARRVARAAARYGAICTGAFALAHWGLLEGKRATTHWAAADALQHTYPSVQLERDALFVNDGNVWSSGGVTAGIDMALEMVAQDCGRSVAALVGRHLLLQVRRTGNQSQYSYLLAAQAGRYAELVSWIKANLHRPLAVAQLSDRVNESVRTFHRHFTAETGHTPAVFLTRARLDHARALLEAGQPIKTVAKQSGLGSQAQLRIAFQRAFGMSASAYASQRWGRDTAPDEGAIVDTRTRVVMA